MALTRAEIQKKVTQNEALDQRDTNYPMIL